jgi:hypothetical protein
MIELSVDKLFQKKGFELIVTNLSSVQMPPSWFKDSPRFVQSLTVISNLLPLQLGAAHFCVDDSVDHLTQMASPRQDRAPWIQMVQPMEQMVTLMTQPMATLKARLTLLAKRMA